MYSADCKQNKKIDTQTERPGCCIGPCTVQTAKQNQTKNLTLERNALVHVQYRIVQSSRKRKIKKFTLDCLMYRSMYSTDCKAKNQQLRNTKSWLVCRSVYSTDCKAKTNKQKANPKLGIGTECLGWCVGLCTVQTAKPKQTNKQKANPKLGIETECLGWCVGLCTVQTAKPKQTKSQSKTWHWNRMSWLVCGPRYSTDYKAKNKTTTKLDIGTERLGWCIGPCTIQTARQKNHTHKKERPQKKKRTTKKLTKNLTLEQNVLVGV